MMTANKFLQNVILKNFLIEKNLIFSFGILNRMISSLLVKKSYIQGII